MADVVVLVHLARPDFWAPVLARLEPRHTVTFLDVPGFGDTPVPAGLPVTLEGMAEGVRRELAARRLTDAHLVGISMAGAVALEVAREGGVAGVTAISPPGSGRVPRRRHLTAHPDRVPYDLADATILGIPRNMRHLVTGPLPLASLSRVIVGYRVLPSARHVTLHGCAHLPTYDDPEQVARVILDAIG